MDERDRTLLTRLVGPGTTAPSLTAAAEKIKELAFSEWMDWMSGLYRPISISQNNVDRIAKIYGSVVGDVPTVNDLVDIFNLPIGRARYVISVLKYGSHPSFRHGALTKLASVLRDSIKDKEDEDTVTPFIESGLLGILDEVEQEILYVDENPDYDRCERLPGFRGIGRECEFTVSNAKIVIQKLEEKVAKLVG